MSDGITFRSDFTVDDVTVWGESGDDSVLRAMLVSTLKDDRVAGMDEAGKRGRIRYLMQGRHGTPFEHNQMKFRVEAPIFVFREWHRHRIGISINEQSGRYTEFLPVFYVPPPHRPIVQEGKQGAYIYVPGTTQQYEMLRHDIEQQAEMQWASYQDRLKAGIALEVARMSLGVNIYSSMYWTCNARSLMAFCSLRTRRDAYWREDDCREASVAGDMHFTSTPGNAMFPSKPMWEIEQCANALEGVFRQNFPLTYEAWDEMGRVAP